MRYVKQFGIILLISFLGEVLHALLPLPVPASIYGIVLLFLCLQTGLLKVSAIRETTFVVMVCAGRVTQRVIRRGRKGKEEACD